MFPRFPNAAPQEPPVNHPDYFIMNLNLSSSAASSDRSPGLANALGYFWQHENPQNIGSFHISTLSNHLSPYWSHSLHCQVRGDNSCIKTKEKHWISPQPDAV